MSLITFLDMINEYRNTKSGSSVACETMIISCTQPQCDTRLKIFKIYSLIKHMYHFYRVQHIYIV